MSVAVGKLEVFADGQSGKENGPGVVMFLVLAVHVCALVVPPVVG